MECLARTALRCSEKERDEFISDEIDGNLVRFGYSPLYSAGEHHDADFETLAGNSRPPATITSDPLSQSPIQFGNGGMTSSYLLAC